LHVTGVVPLLNRADVGISVASADRAAAEQPDSCACGGADRWIAGRCAERRTRGGPDGGADRSARDRAADGSPLRRDAGRLKRELSAGGIVSLELLEGFARAWENHHAGARRHGRASAEK
jgi:hypothetical protein